MFFFSKTHDRMDQSSSEYIPIVTDIVTIGNNVRTTIENEAIVANQPVILNNDSIEKETKGFLVLIC